MVDYTAQQKVLETFEFAGPGSTPAALPAELEAVLEQIEAVGVPFFAWEDLRKLLQAKLVIVLAASQARAPYVNPTGGSSSEGSDGGFEADQARLLAALDHFNGAPFTLQRLAEVLRADPPQRYYRDTRLLLEGCEKLLSVSSLIPREDPVVFFARKAAAAAAAAVEVADGAQSEVRPPPASPVAAKDVEGAPTVVGDENVGCDKAPSTSQVNGEEEEESHTAAAAAGGGDADGPALSADEEGAAATAMDTSPDDGPVIPITGQAV